MSNITYTCHFCHFIWLLSPFSIPAFGISISIFILSISIGIFTNEYRTIRVLLIRTWANFDVPCIMNYNITECQNIRRMQVSTTSAYQEYLNAVISVDWACRGALVIGSAMSLGIPGLPPLWRDRSLKIASKLTRVSHLFSNWCRSAILSFCPLTSPLPRPHNPSRKCWQGRYTFCWCGAESAAVQGGGGEAFDLDIAVHIAAEFGQLAW